MPDAKLTLFNAWAPIYDWLLPSVFYQAIHQRLLSYVQLPPTPRVLDLGCGTGKLLNRLARQYPDLIGTGLDFSPEMLQQARQRSLAPQRLTYVQGKTDRIPLADGQFDAVFCSISFLHYPDPLAVLNEIRRLLKPGGYFYLADFAPSQCSGQEIWTLPAAAGRICFYSRGARADLGRQAGLLALHQVHLLGPVMLTMFTCRPLV